MREGKDSCVQPVQNYNTVAKIRIVLYSKPYVDGSAPLYKSDKTNDIREWN